MRRETAAGRAARNPRDPRALTEVELRAAAVALKALEHLAFCEFAFPTWSEDGVLVHDCCSCFELRQVQIVRAYGVVHVEEQNLPKG